MFGEFRLAGDIPLGALAEFYDLVVPPKHVQRTAAELFAERFDGEPQVGDRLRLGQATLVVRDLDDERVAMVGLKFEGVSEALFGESLMQPRQRSWMRRLAGGLRRVSGAGRD